MSMGYEGSMYYTHQKNGYVYFKYAAINKNFDISVKRGFVYDGSIAIDKAFVLYTSAGLADALKLGRIRMIRLCSESRYFKLYPADTGDTFEKITLVMLTRFIAQCRSEGKIIEQCSAAI